MTHRACVIGWPVDRSLSPVIHGAAFRHLGLDWIYERMAVAPDGLPAALRRLRDDGYDGASVTMPHKSEAAQRMDSLSEDARLLGAVNTIVVGDGLAGHNTDAPGFERFLRDDLAFDGAGAVALVLGAGGAARACALALTRLGVGQIVIAVRTPSRAIGLPAITGNTTDLRIIELDAAAAVRPNVIVNATPLGAAGEPLPELDLSEAALAVDLLYRPALTTLVRDARAAGVAAANGLGLLLHQGALAFELWTGRPAPLDVMSAAAVAALADHPE